VEEATREVLSGVVTNSPRLLEDHALRNLPPSPPLHSRQWSAVLDGLAFVSLIGWRTPAFFITAIVSASSRLR